MPENDIAVIEEMEDELRASLIHLLLLAVWLCLAADLVFYVYYLMTGSLDIVNMFAYPFKRVLLPFAVNMIAYVIAWQSSGIESLSALKKNRICCFAMMTLGGSMSIFHSYFTPIWCAPSFVMLLSSSFHDRSLQRQLLIYDYLLVLMSAAYVINERPAMSSDHIQSCVIVEVMTTVIYFLTLQQEKFNSQIQSVSRNIYKKEVDYERQLHFDTLTGVYSRGYLFELAEQMMKDCSADNPISIAISDIDDFKKVNDTYGHDCGDEVLSKFGQLIALYQSDKLAIGRFGGEEFVFIFNGGSPSAHRSLINEVRYRFSLLSYTFTKSTITISGGIASTYEERPFREVLKAADNALYISKKNGKNRVTKGEL